MRQRRLALFLAIGILVRPSEEYSSGAPTEACPTLHPGHGVDSKPFSALPYQLTFSKSTINTGETVQLTLEKIQNVSPDFKGFFVQGRNSATNKIVGTFVLKSSNTVARGVSCDGTDLSGITHTSLAGKSIVDVTWQAPAYVASDVTVKFVYTVVQSFSTLWSNQEATATLTVKAGGRASVKPDPKPLKGYDDCGKSVGCFGMPIGCEKKSNCKVLAKYALTDDTVKLDVIGQEISANNYIAVGISKDSKMGDDMVFACINGVNEVLPKWNKGRANQNDLKVTISNSKVETNNGKMTCSFELTKKVEATPPGDTKAKSYDFGAEKYHLLVSTGAANGKILTQHTNKLASGEAADFASVKGLSASVNYSIQIHGMLMVFAWVACATCGMVIARYYKETWKNVKPAGADLWFRAHQLFMGLAISLTLIAFIVILASIGFFPYTPESIANNPHPAIGMSCIICALIQPIMAFFRPHPGTQNRWIFDWAHWLIGNITFLLAVIALFLAVELQAAKLPNVTARVMIAFIVVHVLTHVVLSLQRYMVQKANKNVHDVNGNTAENDLGGSAFRKLLLVIYIVFMWCVAIGITFLIFRKTLGIDAPGGQAEAEAAAEAETEAEPETE